MDPEILVEESECEECGTWFEYIAKNLSYPRGVCDECLKKWRKHYVG